jgi:photosystem II stability/assembly factor-like uncharacterized protein
VGSVFAVAVAPSRPNVLYLGTAMGVFRSSDGGRSWRSAGLAVRGGEVDSTDPRITSLAVDPRAPATVYAARSGWADGGTRLRQELFGSTNSGRSRRALGIAARLVAVSPADPGSVFAIAGAIDYAKENRLLRSTDGGRSWRAADSSLPPTRFAALAFDPVAPGIVYAATSRGVLESTDGGTGWREAGGGVSRQPVSAIAVDPRICTPSTPGSTAA